MFPFPRVCSGSSSPRSQSRPGDRRDRKPASETPWTKKLWIYDFRTNQHFTLKERPLRYEDLAGFIRAYNPANRHQREQSERFRPFNFEDLVARDKASLDIFWLRDESLEDPANLPPPEVIAQAIVEDLEAALSEFAQVAQTLAESKPSVGGQVSHGLEPSQVSE